METDDLTILSDDTQNQEDQEDIPSTSPADNLTISSDAQNQEDQEDIPPTTSTDDLDQLREQALFSSSSLLRKQCELLKADKIRLQAQIDDFQLEKAALAYDKEHWSREKEVLTVTKQWYMNEISNREQRINELRIGIIEEKSEMQNEIILLNKKVNDMERANGQLTRTLEDKDRELADLRANFKKVLDNNVARMTEFEAEIRTRERLTNVYKEAQEALEKEIEEIKENEARLEYLLLDKDEAFQNISVELTATIEQHKIEINAKDDEIRKLTDEVAKSTELLNAGFRLNRLDEDCTSPVAAAAISLLKSGISLTGIYTEHCKLVAELEKRNAEFAQLERHLTEIINEFEKKAPHYQEQKKAYEKMLEHNEYLRLQNELLITECQMLQSKGDSAIRDLEFAKRELQRVQHQYNFAAMQVQRLLYVIERGSDAFAYQNLNGNGAADNILFSNIQELQTKNIELLEELERLRHEQKKMM